MSKKKLREWEIPMNLSDKERKLYGMTTTHKLNNTAKHKCKFYVNADWSYLKCDCGKRKKPKQR